MSDVAVDRLPPAVRAVVVTPLIAYFVVIASEFALLAVMATDRDGPLSLFVFLFVFAVLARVLFLLPNATARMLVAFFTLFGSVHFGFFAHNSAIFDFTGIQSFFMDTDRFTPFWNIGALFLALIAGQALLESLAAKRPLPATVLVLCTAYFIIKTSLNLPHYSRVSYYQVTQDWVLITSAAVIASAFRPRDIDLGVLRRWMPPLLAGYVTLELIDSLGSLLHAVPWAVTGRGGFQGIFSGTENQFGFQSAVAGLVVLVTMTRKNAMLHLPLFLFFCGMAIQSMALTAFMMMSIVSCYIFLVPTFPKWVLNLAWDTLWLGIAAVLFFFGSQLGIFDINSSLISRLGSVIAPFQLWQDSPWFGLGTGIFDTSHITNMAAYTFDAGAASFLLALNMGSTIASEVGYRADQFQGGEINPHLTPLALVYFYGLFALPFAAFFTLYLPGHLMSAIKRIREPVLRMMPVITLYYVMVAMLNPVLPLFEIVFTMLVAGAVLGAKPAPTFLSKHG